MFVPADEDRLTQVVVNLTSNALKYTPEGRKTILRLRVAGEEARVEVEDTGGGISEENRRKATAVGQARLDDVRAWAFDYLKELQAAADTTGYIADTTLAVDGRDYLVSLFLRPGPNVHAM